MKISELIKVLDNECALSFIDAECSGIFNDSRKVVDNSIFVCIKGLRSDGHDFAEETAKNGAAIVICEHDVGLENQIIVEDTREAYAILCAEYFSNPAKKLKLIGITGTAGKTTTSYMIKSMLTKAGHKVGLIGTIQNMIGDEILPSHYTTPDAYELHSLFDLMQKGGCDYCVMEVSSMALHQKRVFGLEFNTAVFTNFSQDHLDYHITMDNYLDAKLMLFSMCKNAVINYDSKCAKKVIDFAKDKGCNVLTYSTVSNDCDYSAKEMRYKSDSVSYVIVTTGKIGRVKVMVPGVFMVYNSLAAGVVSIAEGIDFDTTIDYMQSLTGVKGVVEVVPNNKDCTFIIDFAHTPDELENVIKMLSEFKQGRLITLFGCGGDRDNSKRAIMGRIVSELSDFTIVTSDNPRTENPSKIIEDIVSGIDKKANHIVIEDREQAIIYAVKNSKPNDIVLFAGKGYETYQILNSGTIRFDEREVIAKALSE